jgi:hypothetical protein
MLLLHMRMSASDTPASGKPFYVSLRSSGLEHTVGRLLNAYMRADAIAATLCPSPSLQAAERMPATLSKRAWRRRKGLKVRAGSLTGSIVWMLELSVVGKSMTPHSVTTVTLLLVRGLKAVPQ